MIDNKSDFGALAAQEINDLHRVLQAWFRAEGPNDQNLVLEHFDDSFRMIAPGGNTVPYSKFVGGLSAMRGSRPGLVMDISDVEVRFSDSAVAVISYRERQSQDGQTTDRLSTAILIRKIERKFPQWVHLHETWAAK